MVEFLSLPEFCAGVGLHPSHPFVYSDAILGQDEAAKLKACGGKPMLFMPAKEDMDSVKKGGLAEKARMINCNKYSIHHIIVLNV